MAPTWTKAKAKVRSAVAEIAQELVVLYQTRVHTSGHAFAPDTPWQHELEDAFPFERDARPAQRHRRRQGRHGAAGARWTAWCAATSGFGKTEVAIRAVFKAVQDGKQAAVLVPTTLLAQQHYQTFSDRFAGYPVRVEVLSRFLTTAQAKRGRSRGCAAGEVDVVIGTHRLLSGDVDVQATSGCWSSTRSSASASATRSRSSSCRPTSTCSP